jgi:hypothetical protein
MVVTMGTVLIALVIFGHVLPERFLALFADERHIVRFPQRVAFGLCVALCAVEPLLAAGGADRYLSIQDVFTATDMVRES